MPKSLPTCVYCAARSGATEDHVFARQFFLKDRRGYLPKVPACSVCNNDKARLEHYLGSVLSFGGRHADSLANLTGLVPGRLEQNKALHRKLDAGRASTWVKDKSGLIVPSVSVPIDSGKIDALFNYIVRGMAWHHWGVILRSNAEVWSGILSRAGEGYVGHLMSMAGHKVDGDLGQGTFTYSGLQSKDEPHCTAWRFVIYGGLMLGGDADEPEARQTVVGGVSASPEAIAALKARTKEAP